MRPEGAGPAGAAGAHRRVTWLLLLAVFLFGLAFLAALPPFEGMDETAHWSSIQQIGDRGQIPVYGTDRLSADLDRYPGPRAAPQGQPYRDWFAGRHPADALRTSGPTAFSQGTDVNWQAQHPPLYYLALAPLYRLGARLDWLHHLLLLRLASWCMAFAGFAWGALRTQAVLAARGIADARLLLPPAWPFLFPQFFPEFARLTNDTLCILILAAVWSVALRAAPRGLDARRAALLGALLGAGLLTKAFFLPITAGVLALFGWAAWWRHDLAGALRAAAAMAPGLCAGALWYAGKLVTTHTLTGGNDFIHLRAAGGLWAGLAAHFGLPQFGLGLLRVLAGFAWAGTWSFVHPDRLLVAPVVVSLVLAICLYLRACRSTDLVGLAPLFLAAPFLGGLCLHLLTMIAASGQGAGTPGWYLHILAAPLSLALALGWSWPRLQGALAAYGVAFGAAMVPWQLAFTSGCLTRAGTGGGTLAGGGCLIDPAHLSSVALPGIALAAGLAGTAALCLVARSLREAQRNARVWL
jgi:hypothetical protein